MTKILEHFSGKSHVIWDWNGTLLSDIHHAVETVNQLLTQEGLPRTSVEAYRKIFGFPVVEYYKRLGFDTSPSKFSELCEQFNQIFHDGLHRCELWPGAREVLTTVKSLGLKQSVLSASEHTMLQSSLRQFAVDHLFDHVMGIGDKKAGGKIESGRRLMAEAKTAADRCVLVGDTDHDLEVAKALRIDAILVDHGHQCPTRLTVLHNNVIKVIE